MTPELEKKIEEAAKVYLVRKYEANFDDDSGIVSASFFTAISDDMISFATTSTKVKDYWQKGMYTEEEVKNLIHQACFYSGITVFKKFDKWFEQNKKK